jgi:hypothetical protein
MRALTLAAVAAILTPVACAPRYQQAYPAPYATSPAYGSPPGPSGPYAQPYPGAYSAAPAGVVGQAEPGNCGTPEEPKSCPPMPRRALPYYPEYRR